MIRGSKLHESGLSPSGPFHTFCTSVQGARHRRHEVRQGLPHPCEDFCGCGQDTAVFAQKKRRRRAYAYIAAADGHGDSACFRSGKGAEFAVMAARYVCRTAAEKHAVADLFDSAAVVSLASEIVSVWNTLVHVDISSSPVTEAELTGVENGDLAEQFRSGRLLTTIYGTTLAAAFFCSDGWFALQIGDGSITACDADGRFVQPVPPDERCFMNRTTSLCDENAADEIRFYVSTELPQAVFCATDGLDDSFNTKAQLSDFYRKLLLLYTDYAFDRCGSCTKERCSRSCRDSLAEAEIASYLPTLSSRGSGDDISLAVCLCRKSAQSGRTHL